LLVTGYSFLVFQGHPQTTSNQQRKKVVIMKNLARVIFILLFIQRASPEDDKSIRSNIFPKSN
jgi:hypothetical protein